MTEPHVPDEVKQRVLTRAAEVGLLHPGWTSKQVVEFAWFEEALIHGLPWEPTPTGLLGSSPLDDLATRTKGEA